MTKIHSTEPVRKKLIIYTDKWPKGREFVITEWDNGKYSVILQDFDEKGRRIRLGDCLTRMTFDEYGTIESIDYSYPKENRFSKYDRSNLNFTWDEISEIRWKLFEEHKGK